MSDKYGKWRLPHLSLVMLHFLRRPAKYLTVSLINLALLTILLALWTDDLEMSFHPLVRPFEFLRILIFTLLSLMGMWFYTRFLKRKGVTALTKKVCGAAVVTVLISLYLYVSYIPQVVSNVITHRSFRTQLAAKIKPAKMLANGTRATGLDFAEYETIATLAVLPQLSPAADNIEYNYAYDGFLPDYTIELTYDLPIQNAVEVYDIKKGRYSRTQSVEIVGSKKHVSYSEFVY